MGLLKSLNCNICGLSRLALTAGLLFLSVSAFANPWCAYTFAPEQMKQIETEVEAIRLQTIRGISVKGKGINQTGRATPVEGPRFAVGEILNVNGVEFKIEGLMSHDSNNVFRAVSADGRRVLVEDYPSMATLIYKKRLTEYLLMNGFEVPQILGQIGFALVREYFSGPSLAEITTGMRNRETGKLLTWSVTEQARMRAELETLNAKYKSLVQFQFVAWFQATYPAEFRQIPHQHLAKFQIGDSQTGSYVYSVTLQRWQKVNP